MEMTVILAASSSSSDTDDQPGWTKMTTLPESGMRQRWVHKRERTPKNNSHASKGQGVATPKTVASIASDFCGDILFPIVGKRYEHNSSEEVTPTNSNDAETDTMPPAQPDIEEGVRVEESKSQETELNIQSSSSSSAAGCVTCSTGNMHVQELSCTIPKRSSLTPQND